MGAWTLETQARVVAALTEGNGIRGTGRLIKGDKNAVLDLAMRVGAGCMNLHDRLVRAVASLIVEVDETWSFIHTKQSRVDPTRDPDWFGDAYTFIGLDAVVRLVLAYHVGKRTAEDADVFARDLRSRLTMVPHLSTDGFNAYPAVIAKHFGGAVDFGTAVKHYRTGSQRGPDHRYEPPRDPFVTKHTVIGAPREDLIGTAHVERYNLTQRHIVGRTRRLCLAFSKTKRGHVAGMALGVMAYNFVREHSALGKHVTPAMASGLADRPWTIAELTERALEAADAPSDKPEAVPLTMPAERAGQPVGASRPLANGGFLRVVKGAAPPAAKPAAPPPAPPPVAPSPGPAAASSGPAPAPVQALALSVVPPPADEQQLEFRWSRERPPPPPPAAKRLKMTREELSRLFGIDLVDEDPEKGGE